MAALDLVTSKQLAGFSGLDARTCRKHALAAGLHAYEGGRFERGPALDAIKANHAPDLTLGHAAAGRGNAVLPGASDLTRNRARSEAARAHRLERENAKRDGELISRSAVETALADIIARARQHFAGMGPRVAARLAVMNDERAIIELLDDEARTTLRQLANDAQAELLA